MDKATFDEDDIKKIFGHSENVPKDEEIPLTIEFQPEQPGINQTRSEIHLEPPKRTPPPTLPPPQPHPLPQPTTTREVPELRDVLKVASEKHVLAKTILKFIGIFLLIFAISFSIINAPALMQKMKYFWDVDYRNNSWAQTPVAAPQKNQSRLIISHIKVDVPIIWNVSEDQITENLQNGVVHYRGTAMPGQDGNIFITGHSSYYIWAPGSYKDVFALLNKLSAGDKIYLQYDGNNFVYEVEKLSVVNPDRMDVLAQSPGKTLTLMTCVPIGTDLKRLIVIAKQVSN